MVVIQPSVQLTREREGLLRQLRGQSESMILRDSRDILAVALICLTEHPVIDLSPHKNPCIPRHEKKESFTFVAH